MNEDPRCACVHVRGLTAKRLHVGQELYFFPFPTLFLDKAGELRLKDTANINVIYVSDTLFVAIDSLRAHSSHSVQGLT